MFRNPFQYLKFELISCYIIFTKLKKIDGLQSSTAFRSMILVQYKIPSGSKAWSLSTSTAIFRLYGITISALSLEFLFLRFQLSRSKKHVMNVVVTGFFSQDLIELSIFEC